MERVPHTEIAVGMDASAWAEQTFAAVDLGDPRRTRRLVQSAAMIVQWPEQSFPQIFD